MMLVVVALLLLAGPVSFILGIIAFFRPQALGLNTRVYSPALLLGPLALIGLGMALDPVSSEKPGSEADSIAAGVFLIGVWALFGVGLPWLLKRAAMSRRLGDPPSPPNPHSSRPAPAPSDIPPIPGPLRITYDPDSPDVDSGTFARFVYIDSDGVVTTRVIRNWHINGNKLTGYCELRKAVRTFRVDRVDEWIDWRP